MSKKTIGSAALAALLALLPAQAQRMHGGGFRGGGVIVGRGGGVGHVFLPPGWGLAPRPAFGNLNHPGGVIRIFPSFGRPFRFGRSFVGFGGFPTWGFYGGFVGVPLVLPEVGYLSGQPNVVVIQVPPLEASPSNVAAPQAPSAGPGGRPPVVLEYQAPRAAEPPAPSRPLALLVLKDHTIYAATDYWLEGGRLHYLTSHGSSDSVALDQLDLEFTVKLNAERNVRFELRKR